MNISVIFCIFLAIIVLYPSECQFIPGCLLNPYVSSSDTFSLIHLHRASQDKPYDEYEVYISFTVDYNHFVQIEKLHLRDGPSGQRLTLFSSQDTKIQISPRYMGDKPRTFAHAKTMPHTAGAGSNDISWQIGDQYGKSRFIIDSLNLNHQMAKPSQVAILCLSPHVIRAYISSLSTGIKYAPGLHLLTSFQKSTVCSSVVDRLGGKLRISDAQHLVSRAAKYGLGLVAADSWNNSYYIFFLANSSIIIGRNGALDPGDDAGVFSAPLQLTYRPSFDGLNRQSPVLNSSHCLKATEKLLTLDKRDNFQDFQVDRPIVTVARSINAAEESFITVEGYKAEMFLYKLDHSELAETSRSTRKSWKKRGIFGKLENILAMTIYSPEGKTSRCHILYKSNMFETIVGYINSNIDADYNTDEAIMKANSPIPDDVVYWSTCKKIVSFYGFMYALHDHKRNILEDEAWWNILPQEHFEYPIEAVHADGNNFYFFLKVSTLYHVVVEPSNFCKELKVLSVSKNHHQSQLFKMNHIVHYHTGGRYYDGRSWIPSFTQNKNDPIETLSKGTPLWAYIVGGSIAVLILILLAIIFLIALNRHDVNASRLLPTSSRGSGRTGFKSHQSILSGQSYHIAVLSPHSQPAQPAPTQMTHLNQSVYPYEIKPGHNETASVMPLLHESSSLGAQERKTKTKSGKTKNPVAKTPRSPLVMKDHRKTQKKPVKEKKSPPR